MARSTKFGEPIPGYLINTSSDAIGEVPASRKLAAIALAAGIIMSAVIATPRPVYADAACPGVNPYPAASE